MCEPKSEPAVARHAAHYHIVWILAVAATLRLWAIDFSLPEIVHVDENYYVTKLLMEFVRTGDLNPRLFFNPAGFSYLLYVETWLFYGVGKAFGSFSAYPADLLALWDAGGTPFFLMARLTSAVLGAATVWVVYRIGLSLFADGTVAMLAAFFLSVNFLHVRDSHFGTNDVAMVFVLTVAFLHCVKVYRYGRLRDYLACGLAAGIAIGMKYTAGMIVVPLLLAHFTGARLRKTSLLSLAVNARLMGAVSCMAAAFLLTNPYALLDNDTFQSHFQGQRNKMQTHPRIGQDLLPTWRFYARGLELSCGAWGLPLLIWFCALVLWKRRQDLLLLCAFPLAYLGYMGMGKHYFLRYLLPAIPFCALAMSYAAVWIASRFQGRRRTWVLAGIAATAGWEPAWQSLMLDRVLARQDTRIEAKDWVERSIASGSTMYVEGYGPHTRPFEPGQIGTRKYRILGMEVDQPVAYYEQHGGEYFILSSFVYERFYKDPDRYSAQRAFYAEIRQRGSLVQAFDPFVKGRRGEFHLDEVYAPLEPWRYERPGPMIEVFHLPRGTGARASGSRTDDKPASPGDVNRRLGVGEQGPKRPKQR